MRNIIYISGITASGKTTVAKKLSEFLCLPVYKADDVYSMIARELNYEKQERLVLPEYWKKFDKFGLYKIKNYKNLLQSETGDFIIEGFPLFFEQDRQIIKQIIGDHIATHFKINLPFPKWQEYSEKKFGKKIGVNDFNILNKHFEAPANYYEISDPEILFVDNAVYQRTGLTDKKCKLLDLPNLSDKTVIDLGCNSGWVGRECLNMGAKSVDGVDYNWRYLEEARQTGFNKMYLSDLDNFEFEKKYDIVLCLAVFHYVRDKEKLLAKIAAATKEMFVLEMPISKLTEPVLEFYDTGKCKYFIPSMKLLDYWLNKYFSAFEYKPSVAPDNSLRFIFKCYK